MRPLRLACLLLAILSAVRTVDAQVPDLMRSWLNSKPRPASLGSGTYSWWLLGSDRFQNELLPKAVGAELALSSSSKVDVWHVRLLRKSWPRYCCTAVGRLGPYDNQSVPEGGQCYGTQAGQRFTGSTCYGGDAVERRPLADLLFDNAGYLVGYTLVPDLDVRPSLQWKDSQLPLNVGEQTTSLMRASTIIFRSSEDVLANLLHPELQPLVTARDLDLLVNVARRYAIRDVQVASEVMMSLTFEARHSVASSQGVAYTTFPITVLFDAGGDVEMIRAGATQTVKVEEVESTRGTAAASSTSAAAAPSPDERASSVEKYIRQRLAVLRQDVERRTSELPSVIMNGKTYYLAEAATEAIEDLHRETLSRLDGAPALQQTIEAALQSSEFSLPKETAFRGSTRGPFVLVTQRAGLDVVTTESVQTVMKAFASLIDRILKFETLHPSVRCVSVPTGAHIVIRVHDAASERFGDTNGVIANLWRGIYKGTAEIAAGGFQVAKVDLDVFHDESASISCTFQKLGATASSVCVQTKGD